MLLPLVYIKANSMKHHVKALPKESVCFEYLSTKFDSTSYEKLKEAIFIEYEIRKFEGATDRYKSEVLASGFYFVATCILIHKSFDIFSYKL